MMNQFWWSIIAGIFIGIGSQHAALAQQSLLQEALANISADSIRQHIAVLGHDSLQGRGTGTSGEQKAARYIAQYLHRIGIRPLGDHGSYFQSIPMHGSFPRPRSEFLYFAQGKEHAFVLDRDFLLYKSGAQTYIPQPVPLVFVGYGIIAPEFDYNDYQSVDVEGKVVVCLFGEPPSDDPSYFNGPDPTIYSCPEAKQRFAIARGALGTILIPRPEDRYSDWARAMNDFAFEDITLAYSPAGNLAVLMNPEPAQRLFADGSISLDDIFQMDRSGAIHSFPLSGKVSFKGEFQERDFFSANVIGWLPGINQPPFQKYVIISAHYDHLGIGPAVKGDSIYNGVIDNAAGVAAVLELARVFASLPIKPLQSVIFLFLTGEEKGLLGSTYYIDHPVVPLYKTIANINVDGLALFDVFRDVIGIGAEYSYLQEHLVQVAAGLGLEVSYFPLGCMAMEAFVRSDQLAFARAGIPSILISEGFSYHNRNREDGLQWINYWMQNYYHSPFDDLNQPLNFEAARQHCQLLFAFCHPIADGAFYPDWKPGSPYLMARLRSLAEKR
ncbi:MAG: M28 family peptidase [candidate division KSB1 bacterium]|nr:M28 family peptidase [candidate division KSB1 bacterium]MDZ7342680.1 M28 family peptidase [candidate division KSB1 bacterium]